MIKTVRWVPLAILLAAPTAWAQGLFDPSMAATRDKKGNSTTEEFPLTPQAGPFMVRVASFVDDYAVDGRVVDGGELANALAKELRQKHGIEAYTFRYRADEGKNQPSKAQKDRFIADFVEQYKVRPRIAVPLNPPTENWVVLAGDFDSIDSRGSQSLQKKLAKIDPVSIPNSVRAKMRFQVDPKLSPKERERLISQFNSAEQKGKFPSPLASTMMVRNPLVKNEPGQSIDTSLAKMLLKYNDQAEYSIYKLKAPYTIRVAEFRGLSTIKSKAPDWERSKKHSALPVAEHNANVLAEQLRKQGYEAYVFHGQFASLVCVNGYPSRTDPRLVRDFQAFAQTKVHEFKLDPQVMATPRRPEL
jgi:hypothetical protein